MRLLGFRAGISMKRRGLIKQLEDAAAFLLDWHEGQDWYQNRRTIILEAISRSTDSQLRGGKGVLHA